MTMDMNTARVLSVVCVACVLVARAAAAPAAAAPAAANSADIVNVSTLLYTADHEVTRLGVIFEDDKLDDKTVFFIESETDEQGQRIDYGLYALNHGIKTKLLDNARDIVVVNMMAAAYFAAKDGIYLYDKEKNSAQKYGSVNDEVISLAVENGTGVMYYLNKQHQLYKVTEDGNKSILVDAVKNAEEIVVDYTGHLYYYTADKTFYVYDGHAVRKVEDIPDRMKKVWFVKTPMLVGDYGLVNGDDQFYGIRAANASARALGRPGADVSAASADATLIVYFAKDRKIYEFNILEKIVEGLLEGLSKALKKFAQELRDAFNSINTL